MVTSDRQNTYEKKKENRFENYRGLCITYAVKDIFITELKSFW